MLKNDRWITEQAVQGMLEPFQSGLVRHLEPEHQQRPVLSFGWWGLVLCYQTHDK